jgi:ribosomal-protein-alanine N-acetyltransferase
LLNIAVRRDLQGQGIGRLLLDHGVALAQEQGLESILLEVRPSNDRAVIVYERYGFAGIGVRKGYYPAGENRREDAIVMRLSI